MRYSLDVLHAPKGTLSILNCTALVCNHTLSIFAYIADPDLAKDIVAKLVASDPYPDDPDDEFWFTIPELDQNQQHDFEAMYDDLVLLSLNDKSVGYVIVTDPALPYLLAVLNEFTAKPYHPSHVA